MKDHRKFGEQHIRNSLRQIDENNWLIGDLILRRGHENLKLATWKDDDGFGFFLTVAPHPLPTATTEVDSPLFSLVYEAGDASAVWRVGNNAILKARYTLPGITSESTTLQYVQDQKPSFALPEILYHAYYRDRNFLFLRKIPGITLAKSWPNLDEHWRQNYVEQIARLIHEMAQWRGDIGGVDGQGLLEGWAVSSQSKQDFSAATLQANFEELEMDCSDCVFYHADLAPVNILVEETPQTGQINLIDFELSGLYPRLWVRTKFAVCGAFDVEEPGVSEPAMYRKEVEKALADLGYKVATEAWYKRRDRDIKKFQELRASLVHDAA